MFPYNLACYCAQLRPLDDCQEWFNKALAIDEQSYGPNHPEVATDLNNLAQLLDATNRLVEAEPLMPAP